jgi:hypothetical protein
LRASSLGQRKATHRRQRCARIAQVVLPHWRKAILKPNYPFVQTKERWCAETPPGTSQCEAVIGPQECPAGVQRSCGSQVFNWETVTYVLGRARRPRLTFEFPDAGHGVGGCQCRFGHVVRCVRNWRLGIRSSQPPTAFHPRPGRRSTLNLRGSRCSEAVGRFAHTVKCARVLRPVSWARNPNRLYTAAPDTQRSPPRQASALGVPVPSSAQLVRGCRLLRAYRI